METTTIKTRIAEIDAERKALYQRGGTYLGTNGQPKYFVTHDGRPCGRTNAEGWAYIKPRYAVLSREREALVAKLGK